MSKWKKDLSVLAIMARASLYKIFSVFFCMAAVELGLFIWQIREANSVNAVDGFEGINGLLENLLEDCFTDRIFFVALWVILVILVWADSDRNGSKPDYLTGRLSNGIGKIYGLRFGYHAACLIMLIAVQVGVAFCMYGLYVNMQNPEYVSSQALFLTFYRNEFLHSIFPMEEIGLLVRNILLLIVTSLETAGMWGLKLRSMVQTGVLFVAWFVVCFSTDIGNHMATYGVIVMLLCLICFPLYNIVEMRRLRRAKENE